jgi:hypothetical protein
MSNGFVVFTCGGSNLLEVWRWAEDQAVDPVRTKPEPHQIDMYQVRLIALHINALEL